MKIGGDSVGIVAQEIGALRIAEENVVLVPCRSNDDIPLASTANEKLLEL